MKHPTCRTCRYWEAKITNMSPCRMGACRRYPPDGNGDLLLSPDRWCGEHRATAEEEQKAQSRTVDALLDHISEIHKDRLAGIKRAQDDAIRMDALRDKDQKQ